MIQRGLRHGRRFPALAMLLLVAVLGVGALQPPPAQAVVRVFAFNDLGMHCYDGDFSIFSILPLFNVVHAQVIEVGPQPTLLDNTSVRLTYRAQADAAGSINTTSRSKTNFWRFEQALFGVNLPIDTGLLGARMPGPNNAARPMAFDLANPQMNWFSVEGIPITTFDDALARNPFPLMSIQARNAATGAVQYSLPTVVPASDEMACETCHLTGGVAASDPAIRWNQSPNPVIQNRMNILILHDERNGTALRTSRPVLCASCHYSLALDLQGAGPNAQQQGQPFMSRAMHGFHAPRVPQTTNSLTPCANCHPAGGITECLRGAMGVAGIVCSSCHGNMFAVAGTPPAAQRTPWVDLPKCQSCHTGDAASNLGSIRFTRTWVDSARVATMRQAPNSRFAENPNTLFRFSLGHNGVACESCHGSPHAEWPSREANDNRASIQLQGHTGPILECSVCHGQTLPPNLDGPHGLHNIADLAWADGNHARFYEADRASCVACHGSNLMGTVLSVTPVARTLNVEDGPVTLPAGTQVRCNHCHGIP